MADRSIVVRLRAEIDGFKRGMAEAAKSTSKVGESAKEAEKTTGTAMERMVASAGKHKDAWDKVGRGMAVTGAVLAAGVALSVKTFADFDAQMSQVKTLSGATTAEMKQLTDAALTMGQSIGFSAKETAQAETELVKAGVSVKDIMGGALVGALNLAAAGQIDVAQATEIASSAMTQFGLAGKDIPHLADLLAAGADKSLGGVEDLGMALKQGGLVASQFGLSIDQTVGTLAQFASAGLIGSDAGTSLKTMFTQLASPSKLATSLMEKYNLELYDSQGKFLGAANMAQELHDKLGPLNDRQRQAALTTIFGTDAIRGATILMKGGAKANEGWIKSLEVAGFAASQAGGKMNNLQGDLKKLRAALESDLIRTGSSANDSLRSLTKGITGVVKAYGDLPGPVQNAVLAIAGVSGAALLAGAGLVKVVGFARDAGLALKELGVTAATTSTILKGIGGIGIVVGVAAIGNEVGKLAGRATVANVNVTDLAGALQQLANGSKAAGDLGNLFDTGWSFSPFRHEVTSASEALKDFAISAESALGTNFGDKIDRIGGGQVGAFGKQVEQLDAALAQMVKDGNIQGASDAYDQLMASITAANKAGAHIPVAEVRDKFVKYQKAIKAAADAQEAALPPTRDEADAMRLVGDAADSTDPKVKALADQLAAFQTSVSKAFNSSTDVLDSFQAKTGKHVASVATQLTKSYARTKREARTFAADIQLATKQGLDPTVVAKLLEAGPKQAAPILQAMVSDHSGRLIKMANDSERTLAVIQASVVEEARLTNLAVTSNTDTMTHDLANAMTISKAEADSGGRATAHALSKQLGIGAGNVKRIADEFGINIATGVKGGTDKAGGSVDGFGRKVNKLPKHHSTTFAVPGLSSAATDVADFANQLQNLPTQRKVELLYETNYQGVPAGIAAPAPKRKKKADGGPIEGSGGPRQDNIPIWASNGEYVVNAASTRKHRALVEAINADKFADGGLVSGSDRYSAAHFSHARASRFANGGMASVLPAAPQPLPTRQVIFTGDLVSPSVDQLARQVVTRIRRDEALHPTYY